MNSTTEKTQIGKRRSIPGPALEPYIPIGGRRTGLLPDLLSGVWVGYGHVMSALEWDLRDGWDGTRGVVRSGNGGVREVGIARV